MSQTLHQSEATPSPQTLPSISHAHDDSIPAELLAHIDRLRLILPVISVSVMALHRRDAESDTDIAFVLHEHACEPLIARLTIERVHCVQQCFARGALSVRRARGRGARTEPPQPGC